jgi:hypothetical protein
MSGSSLDREQTRKFAIAHHRGQKRADGTPYYRHPLAVAMLAESWGVRFFQQQQRLVMPLDRATIEDMWHAAVLHDTMEDSSATWDDIVAITNIGVADFVSQLSHDNRLSKPRRQREYAACLFAAEPPVKIIKLADLCCNLQDAVNLLWRDPEKAKTFLWGWPDEVLTYLTAIDKLGKGKFSEEWNWCCRVVARVATSLRQPSKREEILREIYACPGVPSRWRK